MNPFKCELCSCDLTLTKTTRSRRRYRIRRYKCLICGFEKTIFGSGQLDEEGMERQVEKDVKKMYRQQERNNQ